MVIIYLCIFFLGASVASFVNATIYRIENGYKYPKIINEGSHCEYCKKQLSWIELIPILGFLITKGKCKKCKKKINIYYPLSEFFLGLSFLLFILYSIPFYLWIILILLFILSYYDYLYRGIPKKLTHIFLCISILFFFFFNINIPTLFVISIITLSLIILVAVMKKSFGTGDILILIGIGLVSTYKSFLMTFWIGIVTALLCTLVYSFLKKENLRKIKIPMIPFFTISFVLSLLWGDVVFEYLFNII